MKIYEFSTTYPVQSSETTVVSSNKMSDNFDDLSI